MIRSDSLINIAPALLAAQQQIGAAKKDATNPFFHSSYADLGSVMEACKGALNANAITVLQPIGSDELGVYVETILLHGSGEYISDRMRISPKSDANPQDQGSAITYARRYSLQSMVFIPAEDDDGNRAAGHSEKPAYSSYTQRPKAYTSKPSGYVPKAPTGNIDVVSDPEQESVLEAFDAVTEGKDDIASIEATTKKHAPMVIGITNDQKLKIVSLMGKKGKTLKDLQTAVTAFKKTSYQELTFKQAETLIKKMESLPDIGTPDPEAIDIDAIDEGMTREHYKN